MPLIIIGVNH